MLLIFRAQEGTFGLGLLASPCHGEGVANRRAKQSGRSSTSRCRSANRGRRQSRPDGSAVRRNCRCGGRPSRPTTQALPSAHRPRSRHGNERGGVPAVVRCGLRGSVSSLPLRIMPSGLQSTRCSDRQNANIASLIDKLASRSDTPSRNLTWQAMSCHRLGADTFNGVAGIISSRQSPARRATACQLPLDCAPFTAIILIRGHVEINSSDGAVA